MKLLSDYILRFLILLTAFITASTLFLSCDHRDIIYDSPYGLAKLNIVFDWEAAPDASPKSMTVYFYRLDVKSSSPYIFDIKDKNGGEIEIPFGNYAVICHNSDSDRHDYTGMDSYNDFGLRLVDLRNFRTMNINPQHLPTYGDERFANYPDYMWVASIPSVSINVRNDEGQQTLTFRMLPVTYEYTFIIHNPIDYDKSMSLSASVSGMTSTVHPGRMSTGEETVSHFFEMFESDGKLIGKLLTFGHCGNNPIPTRQSEQPDTAKHILVVYADLNDGNLWTSTHDVTAQLHKSHDLNCIVELDTIQLPTGIGGGGFSPSVEGWTGGTEEIIGM